ncbi:putative transcriptional regulator, Crp/Fnr family [Emticicia oligotrophica DSM 17448]|uniref:Transcriptional regulator, Crp/Fnr family n=1 Tax=Emticicia oligotrophica (strain DSM 17448 / CIP 109782 / MTCC 6937 / GPTSA100-15) TaxID=929562 RepID=A0ABM5MY98_EMTOG|nr:Crp/Fnr family transcriptional regulator [Emticicia oligotrophica]AFK02135.1 putative transcriptional regulator, Crp/Fnr family [Emticicia oligotrophica DSM 17448]
MNEAFQHCLDFFQQIHPLKEQSLEALLPCLSLKNYSKKDFLVKQGSISDELNFVYTGCVREYFENTKANETNIWFGLENSVAISTYSFFSQKPSLTYIQALEDVQVVSVKHADLQNLFDQFHDIERLGRLIVEHYLVQIEEMKIILQTLSARERYEYMITNRPEFIRRIPLKYLASFLGIQLETLSRVRSQK